MSGNNPTGRHNLRILEIITSNGTIGSEEKNFVTTVHKLRDFADDVTVVYPKGSSNTDYFISEKLQSKEWNCAGKADLLSALKLCKLIKENRIDIIHAHSETSAILAGIAAALTNRPLISSISSFLSTSPYSKSSSIICASQAIRRHCLDNGTSNEKLHVIHNGLELSRYPIITSSDARMALKMTSDIKILGFFTPLLDDVHGIETVIQSWPDINGRFLGARLIIAGPWHKNRDYQEEVIKLGIQESVEFKEKVYDTRTLLGACDVVLIPSKKDAFNLFAIEAMALGKVVIASATGGLKEIVDDESTGVLIENTYTEGFIHTTATLLAETERAESMGNAGRAKVEKNFNADIQIARVREIMEMEVLKNQGKRKNR